MRLIEEIRFGLAFRIMPKRFRRDAADGIARAALKRALEKLEQHLAECQDCRGGDDAE